MNKETLIALRGSIKKWESIVEGTGSDYGSHNCPLCQLFLRSECNGCPVAKTGTVYCRATPYDSWSFDTTPGENGRRIQDNDSAIAAVLELEFLRSLLPSK